MKKIQILMSAYNGERYIREQLDSYRNLHRAEDFSVLIRDDGSKDSTPQILSEYQEKFGYQVISGDNIGVVASVFSLMQNADTEFEYFAFSDQDDVWLPEKLTNALEYLEKEDRNIPLMYAACSYLVDENLKVIGKTNAPVRPLSFQNAIIQNVCVGHTVVINRTMLMEIRDHDSKGIYIHDAWCYLYASAFGKVLFDDRPSTFYRQHGNNVIGYKSGFFENLGSRLRRLKSKEPQKFVRSILAFYEQYGERLPPEARRECENFFSAQTSFAKRIRFLAHSGIYRQTALETGIFRILYLFGKYDPKGLNEKND